MMPCDQAKEKLKRALKLLLADIEGDRVNCVHPVVLDFGGADVGEVRIRYTPVTKIEKGITLEYKS